MRRELLNIPSMSREISASNLCSYHKCQRIRGSKCLFVLRTKLFVICVRAIPHHARFQNITTTTGLFKHGGVQVEPGIYNVHQHVTFTNGYASCVCRQPPWILYNSTKPELGMYIANAALAAIMKCPYFS
jgi:hypothetical protein